MPRQRPEPAPPAVEPGDSAGLEGSDGADAGPPTPAPSPAATVCVAIGRVSHGDADGRSHLYQPGDVVPEEHAAEMVEGVHYERK